MRTIQLLAVSTFLLAGACDHGGSNGHGHGHARAKDAAPMTEVALTMPIAPGKTEAWQHALEDLLGPRYDEYDASRKRYGVTSQTTFLQRTPMGDFAVIHMTGPDVHASFHQMSTSKDAWDVAWRDLTLDLHGVDFAKGDRVFPVIEPAFSTGPAAAESGKPFLFVAPLSADGAHEMRKVAAELMGARHEAYVAARQRLGIRRESAFFQSTAKGDAIVIYWLADDPQAALDGWMTSTDPVDVWLRERAAAVHPVPGDVLAQTVRQNQLIANYP
jgi:hypothetical protein